MIKRPPYYRFCYSPASGDVALSHNQEAKPADLPTHADLAAQLNEPDLLHGYAYRINNGWRLTDWEHRPVTDPHAKMSVAGELSRVEGKNYESGKL